MIIDYGLSNLFSVEQACQHVGLDAIITDDPSMVASADAAILPGVGSFGEAMSNLRKNDMDKAIINFVNDDKPFLGICLGMQLLFTESAEFGNHPGLNIIPGVIRKFPSANGSGTQYKVPQIAWNQIEQNQNATLKWSESNLRSIDEKTYMYFVHSYYAEPKDDGIILSHTNYAGRDYCSSLESGNIFATQFHPEKSGIKGLRVYKNWSESIT